MIRVAYTEYVIEKDIVCLDISTSASFCDAHLIVKFIKDEKYGAEKRIVPFRRPATVNSSSIIDYR